MKSAGNMRWPMGVAELNDEARQFHPLKLPADMDHLCRVVVPVGPTMGPRTFCRNLV